MAKVLPLVRKTVMLEEDKVRKLMKKLKAKSESEAIRIVIENFLVADEVIENFRQLSRRGTVRDAYKRATRE